MKKTLRKKNILLLGIAVVLIAGLAGCTSNAESTKTTETIVTEKTAETVKNVEVAKTVETAEVEAPELTYPIVDTAQGLCYDNSELIECPEKGEDFYGQDAQYTGRVPSYTDNGDGTITDTVTGLIWTQELSDYSMVWSDSQAYAESLTTGGITDWRVPTLKELWSIRDFSQGWPWLDTDYFHLVGDGSEGAQQHSWSSNYYLVDTEESKKDIAFVVNDWTGHIKAMDGKRFVRCVSGETYGINNYKDNGDGTITDVATSLMWAQDDSGTAMNWKDALAYAENSEYAGYDDWRLPNVKELQSIVDYSGVFPTLDTSMFNITQIVNEAGNADYPYFWTSTSNPYIDSHDENGYWYAWYVAFGYAVGTDGEDLHGAGAVRFDTKHEEGADGPDGERYYNYVRLVRGGDVVETPNGDPSTVKADRVVVFEDGDTGMPAARGTGTDALSAQNKGGHPDGPGSQMNQGAPDFAAAAKTLGISEQVLINAMGEPNQGPPDFAAIAKTLGITEAELLKALGMTEGSMPQQGGNPPTDRK
jgi:hypothetical protein